MGKDEFSACSWLKITGDTDNPWFSYATTKDSNTFLFKSFRHIAIRSTTGYTLHDFTGVPLMKNEWYHLCVTWESGGLDFYINGVRVQTTGTAQKGSVLNGGTLVLGQEQDKIGGGFMIDDLFAGEMYNINVFRRNFPWKRFRECIIVGDVQTWHVHSATTLS